MLVNLYMYMYYYDLYNIDPRNPVPMVLGFMDAIFGPASYTQPITLDDVVCFGNETSLLDCSRSAIGVHNCQHRQDASVDCLGRSPGVLGYIMWRGEGKGERGREKGGTNLLP